MIKGKMQGPLGQPILFLGITGEELAQLLTGEEVTVKAEDLNEVGLPPMTVVIHYGKTEQVILDEVAASNGRIIT